jgi:hypothetical protein
LIRNKVVLEKFKWILPAVMSALLTANSGLAEVLSFVDAPQAEKAAPAAVPETIVHVKAVHVSDPTDGDIAAPDQSSVATTKIDRRIEELAPKLRNLPYRTFRLLYAEDRVVPLKRKEIFTFADGQSLLVRPLYINESKVGLSLKWLDKTNAALLDTRLHFDPGESMIVGTDSSPSSGVVLVLEVELVRR